MNDPRDEVPEDETQPLLTLEDVAIKIEHDQPIVDSTAFGVLVDRDGTVLHVMVLRYRDIHRQACIVQVNNRPYEAMVAMSDTEFGQQLSSACDWKYPLGYATQLQMEGN